MGESHVLDVFVLDVFDVFAVFSPGLLFPGVPVLIFVDGDAATRSLITLPPLSSLAHFGSWLLEALNVWIDRVCSACSPALASRRGRTHSIGIGGS